MNRSRVAHFAAPLALATSLACGEAQDPAHLAETTASALHSGSFAAQFDGHDASAWQMAEWANGDPFNCGFVSGHVTFANGFMTLKLDNTSSAGKSFSGGEYRTTDTFSYGRFETKMKAAKASGIVSSFFTYTGPTPWDEIDVEILGKNTNQVQFNYYVNGVGGHEQLVDLGFDASADFHTYAFDWQPSGISWYVDGVLKHSVTGSAGPLPSQPGKIMMNLWNGIGVDKWLGPFSYPGPLYASYDYVTYTPPGSSGNALTVTKAGSGNGTVTSNPGGINCGSTCSATFNGGASVTLTASPASGSTFGGWSGACSGTGTCTVTMTAARTVGATFNSSGGGSSSGGSSSSGGRSSSGGSSSSGSSSSSGGRSSSGGSSSSGSSSSSGGRSSSGGSSSSGSSASSGGSSSSGGGSSSSSGGRSSSGGSAGSSGHASAASGCTTFGSTPGGAAGGAFPLIAAAALMRRLRRRP